MGPFGSDTRRYDMHCKCHSTSICHSWGTCFTFRPLSSIIFMKIASKAMSSWPHRCIKSLKSIGTMDVFSKLDRSDSKATLLYPNSYKSDPKVSKSAPAHSVIIFPGVVVALLTPQNSLEEWIYSAYGPVWVGHKAIWYALQVPFDIYMPLLGSIFYFPAIVFHYFYENCPQSDVKLTP